MYFQVRWFSLPLHIWAFVGTACVTFYSHWVLCCLAVRCLSHDVGRISWAALACGQALVCNRMMVLCGDSHGLRLWCVWELFTSFPLEDMASLFGYAFPCDNGDKGRHLGSTRYAKLGPFLGLLARCASMRNNRPKSFRGGRLSPSGAGRATNPLSPAGHFFCCEHR